MNEVLRGVWDDWNGCRDEEARLEKIRKTLADYERMTDGNKDMALGFLAKVFDVEDIKTATGLIVAKPAEPKQEQKSTDIPF